MTGTLAIALEAVGGTDIPAPTSETKQMNLEGEFRRKRLK
jgi:hypothetical protein